MGWVWWLGAALLLAVIEMLSLDLVLVMFAGGAAVAALLAVMGFPVWVQIVGFAVASGLLLLALRPWLLRHLRQRVPLVETNVHALVGRPAFVVAEVSDRAGRVKLAGEVWSARTDGARLLAPGETVVVQRIDGATAVVGPSTDPHASASPLPRPTEETS
ncbi:MULTISPECIES: NfeD family protein [unclassified Actinotalea]|uniref:NfeD family protein n=1 Tax=unclassified Actinotalea TaxID=2638618 RepID=UPI0015F3EC06|nr:MULTISPECIES: NfeD family protein [unclassified Actinotalea]